MGSDDLFHKLKAKAYQSRQREHGKKEPYPKFLIVCEDTVSGYHYLVNAVKHFRVSSANFRIVGLGQDPLSIVDHAEQNFKQEEASHHPNFERVFCVFDRDTHATYYNAISKVDAINKRIGNENPVFSAITSNPCFEIWLILHFNYTTKFYTASQKKSASNQVVSDLVNYLNDYKKSSKNAFEQTIAMLQTALDNADKLADYCKKNYIDSPATKMDELMDFISTLNDKT